MQTTVWLDPAHMEALKRLAITLGLTQSRGAGVGTAPNVSAVVRCLASMADNAEFVEVVKKLAKESK